MILSSYHQTIIDIVFYILSNGTEYVKNINKGNAFDKIIRNYHQFNVLGEKVYRNKTRIIKYYRFTNDAYDEYIQNNITNLYYEHLIPVSIIKQQLFELNDINKESIKKILNRNEIIILTKSQAKILDKIYKSTVPVKYSDRMSYMQSKREYKSSFNYHKNTIKNCLFNTL